MSPSEPVVAEFTVSPASQLPAVSLAVLMPLAPLILLLLRYLYPESGISNAQLLLVAGIELLVFVPMLWLIRWRRVWLEPGELLVRANFYLKRVPLASIDRDGMRIMDLREHPKSRPLLRTNGFWLPGFSAGHFRDREKRKVFALVTRPRVLLLPLDDGSRVLLSLEHPRRLMNRLTESGD